MYFKIRIESFFLYKSGEIDFTFNLLHLKKHFLTLCFKKWHKKQIPRTKVPLHKWGKTAKCIIATAGAPLVTSHLWFSPQKLPKMREQEKLLSLIVNLTSVRIMQIDFGWISISMTFWPTNQGSPMLLLHIYTTWSCDLWPFDLKTNRDPPWVLGNTCV